jgi:IS5 family transposase
VTLRIVFHLALRQTEGLVGSILELMELDLPVPDHSTLSRRARTLRVAPEARTATGPLHLLVDSTGLKLDGPGEWLIEKHGTRRRKSWRKLHLGVDAETGTIVASTLTSKDVDDAAQLDPLLDQVEGLVASVTADGAYDQTGVYDTVAERHPDAAVIVPPRRCRARRRKPIRRRATTISRPSPSAAAWAGRRLRATIKGPRRRPR